MGFTEVGKMIRQRREALNWTQEHLAAKARISSKHLSRIETGVQQPSLHLLDKIAKAFGSKLQIDIPLEQKTQAEQELDEMVSTLEGKSADEIRRATRVIKALFS